MCDVENNGDFCLKQPGKQGINSNALMTDATENPLFADVARKSFGAPARPPGLISEYLRDSSDCLSDSRRSHDGCDLSFPPVHSDFVHPDLIVLDQELRLLHCLFTRKNKRLLSCRTRSVRRKQISVKGRPTESAAKAWHSLATRTTSAFTARRKLTSASGIIRIRGGCIVLLSQHIKLA